jgi:hypothetical protein
MKQPHALNCIKLPTMIVYLRTLFGGHDNGDASAQPLQPVIIFLDLVELPVQIYSQFWLPCFNASIFTDFLTSSLHKATQNLLSQILSLIL